MRSIALVLVAAILLASLPMTPALAMSTAKEVSIGQGQSDEVDRQSIIVTDPFLTSWVTRIGANLAQYRARTDINYKFEIIDSNEINSFALPGGFIHVDMGLLNFANSDDEVAGVLGHEMGHVERRHVLTLNTKGNILGILIGVLSILSPIVYALGGYGGDLLFNKFSREDELQADQYGLLLMSRAGYDPHAPVDVFERLAKMSANDPAESRADKAFADHPGPKDRVSHLLGYPELDRPSLDEQLARAIHDENEGLYAYSDVRLRDVLKSRPGDGIAKQHAATVAAALTESGGRLDGLEASASATDASNLTAIARQLAAASNVSKGDLAAAHDQAKSGQPELEALFNQLQSLSSTVPDVESVGANQPNLKKVSAAVDHLVRGINGVLGDGSDVLSTSSGLIADNRSTLRDMATPLSEGNLTPKTQALLAYYASLSVQLARSSDDVLEGMQRARAAVAMGAQSVHLVTAFFQSANAAQRTKNGDISDKDMPAVQAAMDAALGAWDGASDMAATGSDLMYAAQTRALSAQITLLDLLSSPSRYAAYQSALRFRFPGVNVPSYATVSQWGVSSGELGCSAWLAFETKQPLSSVISHDRSSDDACPDVALQQHMYAESMEIAEGLLYSDYTNKPQPTN